MELILRFQKKGDREKIILKPITTLRKTLFGTIAIETLPKGREIMLSSKNNEDKWGFTSIREDEGVSGWKIT